VEDIEDKPYGVRGFTCLDPEGHIWTTSGHTIRGRRNRMLPRANDLDYLAYELRAAFPEPFQRLVDVVHGEHDAEVAPSVHRGVAMIRDRRRREEAGELEPAVAVRRAHHGNLDALIAQSSDTSGPFSFDRGPPFELEAELAKEINRPSEVIDDDFNVVRLSAICSIYKVPFSLTTDRF
jgi:hypothetical protein